MKKQKGVLLIGLPTVVNILVLLAFACISMLSLSRAQADYMLAERGRDITLSYYAADSRARLLLSELHAEAGLPPNEAGDEMEAMLNDQGIGARYDSQKQRLTFTLPAGEAGTLLVQLHLVDAAACKITRWQVLPHEVAEDIFSPYFV